MTTSTVPGTDGSELMTTSWGPFAKSRLRAAGGQLVCTTFAVVLMPWPGSRFSFQLQLVAFARGVK